MVKKTFQTRKTQAAKVGRSSASRRFTANQASKKDTVADRIGTKSWRYMSSLEQRQGHAPAQVDVVIATVAAMHKEALKVSTPEITRRLIASLGGTLVSTLAGSKDVKASHKWALLDGPTPRPDTEKRLRFAYEQWQKIAKVEGESVARVWFIGANPWLNYDTPILAIREDRLAEVNVASDALISDAFNG